MRSCNHCSYPASQHGTCDEARRRVLLLATVGRWGWN